MTLIPPAIGCYAPDPHPGAPMLSAPVRVAPSVTQRC
jgi:hypothetical protein